MYKFQNEFPQRHFLLAGSGQLGGFVLRQEGDGRWFESGPDMLPTSLQVEKLAKMC